MMFSHVAFVSFKTVMTASQIHFLVTYALNNDKYADKRNIILRGSVDHLFYRGKRVDAMRIWEIITDQNSTL